MQPTSTWLPLGCVKTLEHPYDAAMANEIPGPWVRRPLSMAMLIVGSASSIVLGPVLYLLMLVIDVVTRTSGRRRSRTVALISLLFVVDLVGRLLVFGAWLVSPLGMQRQAPRNQVRYSRIMTWWTTALMRVISRMIPLPIDTSELDESLLNGNAIVVGRHQSLLDAVLPAMLFGRRGLTVLYTLKSDLRWEPNIDIVGHRMGHVFVNRSPKDLDAELDPIRALGGRIDDSSVGVIFPEGTFFNQRRKDRAIRALEKRDPGLALAAEKMQYLLPPRPAGTLAMLEGAPDADVIVLGHAGFEPFSSIKQILASIGGEHGVAVRAWRFARNTIPTDPSAQIEWLYDRWAEMDDWVGEHHLLGSTTAPTALRASHGGS